MIIAYISVVNLIDKDFGDVCFMIDRGTQPPTLKRVRLVSASRVKGQCLVMISSESGDEETRFVPDMEKVSLPAHVAERVASDHLSYCNKCGIAYIFGEGCYRCELKK